MDVTVEMDAVASFAKLLPKQGLATL